MLLTKQLTIVTVLLFTFLNLLPVEAGIAAYTFNKKQEDFLHLPALFSRYIPGGDGRSSRLVVAEPENACGDIAKASDTGIFVLIRSFDCDFDVKVSNAMAAGYEAAIIHNVGSNKLILMGSYWDVMKWIRINIPAVFVGEGTATALKENYTHEGNHIVLTSAYLGQTILTEVIGVFVTLIFIGLIAGLVGLMVHTLLSLKVFLQRRRRAGRVKEQLNKLPVHKYQEGDTYDVCAVCLEDYQAGDMLWILPCSHAYHKKCVDHWLSKMMKNTCPTCTQKVYSEQA